ncbi:MAG: hypothetical protein R3E39_02960 [Anaerolineae bacterium]
MEIPLYPNGNTLYPADQINIESVEIQPYPDQFRIRVHIRVTPFSERPNLILITRRADGVIVSELNIIETMHHDMEFTLHIRNVENPTGEYTLHTELFYETRRPPQAEFTKTFIIPDGSSS